MLIHLQVILLAQDSSKVLFYLYWNLNFMIWNTISQVKSLYFKRTLTFLSFFPPPSPPPRSCCLKYLFHYFCSRLPNTAIVIALEVHSLCTSRRCLLIVKQLWRCYPPFPRLYLSDSPIPLLIGLICDFTCVKLKGNSLSPWSTTRPYSHRQAEVTSRISSSKNHLNFLWNGYSRQIETHWDK